MLDDLVLIPRVYEKPLDSLDPISKTFDMNITNPLFDFDSKFTLNLDNPIFVIQNKESDEFETETIMEEAQIRRIFLDGYDVLVVRTVIFKISLFKLQNALEGDIYFLESFSYVPPPPPNQENYLPEIRKELKICEAKTDKSSIDEPPEVELKDLPHHLEYTFLEGDNKLTVIIAKDLSIEEKAALIKVLKSHKRAIAWKLSDIKGINPEFCIHKILMEEDYKPAVQHQRRVNPKIHDVIKK
ncbi:hypothetical protein Tco_0674879 [Tanacetum coccineum]